MSEEEAVCAVELDTVEAGLFEVDCGMGECFGDVVNVLEGGGARFRKSDCARRTINCITRISFLLVV